jgi:diguanylate cyclase (GGDEF)-like protein
MQVWQDTFKELKNQYMQRSSERIAIIQDLLRTLSRNPSDVSSLREIMRHFHWLSGSGGMYGFAQVTKLGAQGERVCEELLQDNTPVANEQWTKLRLLTDTIIRAITDEDEQRTTLQKGDFSSLRKIPDILVVDGDQANTLLLSRLLDEQHLGFLTVNTAQAAMEAVQHRMPAGLIVILPLPDATGYELVEKLRALEGGDRPPVLIISNRAGFLDKVQAITCGADGYYEFPVDWETIMQRLMYLLDRNKPSMYNILSVEDDPDQAAFIKMVLESAGYKVTHIADPRYFEEALLAVQPDLLLLDIMMPNISGFELARYVRADERYATVPILFLSTQNALEAHIESARVGADDHLVKPIAPQLLLSAVASRLERARFIKSLLHRDGLTRLLTHAAFMEEAEAVVAQCKRNPEHLACLFIVDLDSFSNINQKYGYQTGDRVLTCLSTIMRQRLRQSDRVGRYAGEELIGIVEDLEEYDAIKLVTRLLDDFARIDHKGPDGSVFRSTFSAGLCMLEPQVMDLERWRRLTEQAVKAAKSAGKNCVMKAQVGRRN